jgi:recombination protein RecA
MPRVSLTTGKEAPPERSVRFLPTGSTNLNLALSNTAMGGWAQGRIVNIVGDRSSGKTLLAIEACASFAMLYGSDRIRYVEAEAAFDEDYAEMLGMPQGIKIGRDVSTVEGWYKDLERFLETMNKSNKPSLYVLDSLDALSDDAEMGRDIDDASYGATKAKKMSELFRRVTNKVEGSNCTLFIISQVRAKIGVVFGEKTSRSGGKALDFYASQILWLSEQQKVTRTVMSAKRVIGLDVKARVRKNKVAPPYRETEFTILFNYGVDDEQSMIDWLKDNGALKALDHDEAQLKRWLNTARENADRESLQRLNKMLAEAVAKRWHDIEEELKPRMRKYA